MCFGTSLISVFSVNKEISLHIKEIQYSFSCYKSYPTRKENLFQVTQMADEH